MSGTSSWLQKQRKSELVELADGVGLKMYDKAHSKGILRVACTFLARQ
jgi:hypothetical protein